MEKTGARKPGCINELAAQWFRSLRERGFSAKTLVTYRCGLKSFAAFMGEQGVLEAHRVSRGHIEAYRRRLLERELRPATVEVYVRSLRGFFRFLEQNQQVFLDPTAGLPAVHAPRRLLPVPSEEEIARLLGAVDTSADRGVRDRALLESLYASGMRVGEALGLRPSDLDWEAGTVRVLGKGRRERVLPLGTAAADWLGRYLAGARTRILGGLDCEALWVSRRGRLGAHAVEVLLRRCARRAAIATPISPHSLRRACATHMLRRGAHPAELQLLLGHAGLRHLSQYLRLSITEIKRIHAECHPGE